MRFVIVDQLWVFFELVDSFNDGDEDNLRDSKENRSCALSSDRTSLSDQTY